MYEYSRAIYLDLRDRVIGSPKRRDASRRTLLSVAERAIEHLSLQQEFGTHPTDRIFAEVRSLFSASDQLRVRLAIDRHVNAARTFFATDEGSASAVAILRGCRAVTSRGNQCQRAALAGRHYCPTHKHLSEAEQRAAA
jgi:hypothetical protein